MFLGTHYAPELAAKAKLDWLTPTAAFAACNANKLLTRMARFPAHRRAGAIPMVKH